MVVSKSSSAHLISLKRELHFRGNMQAVESQCPVLMAAEGNVERALNTALDLLGRFALPVGHELCSAEHA